MNEIFKGDYHLKNEQQGALPLAGKDDKRWQRLYQGLGAGAVVIVAVFLGVFIYQALWHLGSDSITMVVARLTRLPAGFVNGHYIGYSAFQDDLAAVKQFYQFQNRQNPSVMIPSVAELQKSVWERLAKQKILEEQTDLFKVSILTKELDEEFAKVEKDLGSPEETIKMLRASYGWSPAQFKEKVLRPFLLQEKLNQATSTVDVEKLYQQSKTWKWMKI